jgi:hypothetical protein
VGAAPTRLFLHHLNHRQGEPSDTSTKRYQNFPRAYSICREWRQVHLKCAYEISMLDPEDDDGTDLIVDLATATQRELEHDLADAAVTTTEDAHAVLGIALCLLHEGWGAESQRIEHLIGVGRHGLVTIDNAAKRREVA